MLSCVAVEKNKNKKEKQHMNINCLCNFEVLFGPVLEGFGPRKDFQKVGEAYSKIWAKDGL